MDDVNFSPEKIETYFNDIVESVYTLHEQSVHKIIREKQEKADKEEQIKITANIPCDNDADLEDIEGLDEHTKMLVRQLRTKGKLNKVIGTKYDIVNADELLEELKEKVKAQLNKFRKHWTSNQLNMVTILDEFGNERYRIDKARNKINYIMITLVKDAAYVGKYFDVMSWWMANNQLFPELAVRACIVLGKPTHNGFQERVFSRGTYQDTKLKKRLKEENFEMSVLNAVNNRRVQRLQGIVDLGLESLLNEISDEDKDLVQEQLQEQQVQVVQDFFEIGEDDSEEDDGKQKADDGTQKTDDGTQEADKNSDDNDSDSVYSSFSEILCMDGDDDDLSIAQMCQTLHLADEESGSFEIL